MKKWLFVLEDGNCSQSDDDEVMKQQLEDANTCVVNTETGEYQYGEGTLEPIPDQEFYTPDSVDEEEL